MSDIATNRIAVSRVSAAAPERGDDDMEKVRNLLFGSQMREYDRRFGELAERMRSEIERLHKEQQARVGKLDAFVRAELERLLALQQQEREERLAAHQQMNDRLQELLGRLEGLDERQAKETLALRGALQEQAGEQIDALHRVQQELAQTWEQERLRLQDEKTGRDEMAQLFTELALRLTREFELPQQ